MRRPCARCFKVLVDRGYCSGCQSQSATAINERERGSSSARGYGGAWPRARRNYLALHAICVDPYKRHPLVIVPATDVDHIQAVTGPDDPLFWVVDNWQALCHMCHAYKTTRVDGGLGRLKGGAWSLKVWA
jgi:5-methylcytosine-specific restriction protein A